MKKFALVFVSLLLMASGAFAIQGDFCSDGGATISFSSNGYFSLNNAGGFASGTYEEESSSVVCKTDDGQVLVVSLNKQSNGALINIRIGGAVYKRCN